MARQALNTGTTSSQDCSICLGAIAPCQSLFVAPCSHTWHYKCVRRIINGPMWPQFICPNCRAVADLEAEVDDPYADGEWEEVEAIDTLEDVHASGIQETLSRGVDAAIDEGLTSQDDIEPADVQNSLEEAHVHPSSEDSESDMHETTTNMDNLDLSAADQPHSSHSSSAPVDIPSGRNSVTRSATEPGDPRSEQTPSPSGRTPAHLVDSLRGPMTPTNDAGPFVFDGSAGRASRARMSTLSAVADSESQDS
ncbi:MAG: hypothetical protein M1818_003439 [Claussenomyces sp. TS43310]|nr:MAG: hypothetical protein M1818_003439 [Claussenomyces sp. TS43310]